MSRQPEPGQRRFRHQKWELIRLDDRRSNQLFLLICDFLAVSSRPGSNKFFTNHVGGHLACVRRLCGSYFATSYAIGMRRVHSHDQVSAPTAEQLSLSALVK